jgi:DNA-binding transcriptional ArsR family regulator
VDQLPEVYNLESIEQMRALADELRLRIVELLTQQPMTVTQLGEVLGVAPAKVHYHVRELERVGLLRLSFTREKSGILEKYYTAVAKNLSIPSSLLQQTPPDELLAAFNGYLQTAVAGFMRAASTLLRTKPEALTDKSTTMSIGGSTLWSSAMRSAAASKGSVKSWCSRWRTTRACPASRRNRPSLLAPTRGSRLLRHLLPARRSLR